MSSHWLTSGILLLLLAQSDRAAGNGGPARVFVASGRGSIAPLKVRDIRLVSEDLRITLEEDGDHYQVRATYTLSNPHSARRVAFGVPLGIGYARDVPDEPRVTIRDGMVSGLRHQRIRRAVAAAVQSVRISIQGRQWSCDLVRGPDGRVPLRKELDPVHVFGVTEHVLGEKEARTYQPPWMEDPEGLPLPLPKNARLSAQLLARYQRSVKLRKSLLDMSESLALEAWCVADIVVPSGDAVPLTLRYRGVLEHHVDGTAGIQPIDPFTVFGSRYLRYELWPAGYWGGPVRDLSITVDPGPYQTLVLPRQPPGHVSREGKTTWHLENVDLAKSGALILRVDARPLLSRRELARWTRLSGQVLRLRRSSPAGGAHRALDGDPATAWCPTKAKTAVTGRPWLEYELVRPPWYDRHSRTARVETCALGGIMIAARQKITGQMSMWLGDCGNESGTEARLPHVDGTGLPTWVVQAREYEWGEGKGLARGQHKHLGTVDLSANASLLSLAKKWEDSFKKGARARPCMRLTLEGDRAGSDEGCLHEVAPLFLECYDADQ